MLRLHPSSILLSQEEVNKVLSAPCPSEPSPTSPLAPSWDAAIQSTRSRLQRKGKFPAPQSLSSSLPSTPYVLRPPSPPAGSPHPSSTLLSTPNQRSGESSSSRSVPPISPRSEFGEMDGYISLHDFSRYYNLYEDTEFTEHTAESSEAEYHADGEQSLESIDSTESEQPLAELSRFPTQGNPVERERQLDGVVDSDDGSQNTARGASTPLVQLSTMRQAAIRNWAGMGLPIVVGDEQETVLVERRRPTMHRTDGQETRAPTRVRYQTPAWRRNLRDMEEGRLVDEDDMASDDSLSGVVLPPDMAARMEERQRALQLEAARRTIR